MSAGLVSADGANREAALKLRVVTRKLLRYLPVEDGGYDDQHKPAPSLMPGQRLSRVASCAACVVELEGLKVGDRVGHICTHQQHADSLVARSQADPGRVGRSSSGGNRKASEEKILKLVEDMEAKLGMLVKTAATLPPLLYKEDEVLQHLENWIEYCGILSQRADEVIIKMKYDEQVEKDGQQEFVNNLERSIDCDITVLDKEVDAVQEEMDVARAAEMKELCSNLEERITGEFAMAGVKLASLDLGTKIDVLTSIGLTMGTYLKRIRTIMATLRGVTIPKDKEMVVKRMEDTSVKEVVSVKEDGFVNVNTQGEENCSDATFGEVESVNEKTNQGEVVKDRQHAVSVSRELSVYAVNDLGRSSDCIITELVSQVDAVQGEMAVKRMEDVSVKEDVSVNEKAHGEVKSSNATFDKDETVYEKTNQVGNVGNCLRAKECHEVCTSGEVLKVRQYAVSVWMLKLLTLFQMLGCVARKIELGFQQSPCL